MSDVIGHLQPLRSHGAGTILKNLSVFMIDCKSLSTKADFALQLAGADSFAGCTYTAAEANTALRQGQAAAKSLLAICVQKDAQEVGCNCSDKTCHQARCE